MFGAGCEPDCMNKHVEEDGDRGRTRRSREARDIPRAPSPALGTDVVTILLVDAFSAGCVRRNYALVFTPCLGGDAESVRPAAAPQPGPRADAISKPSRVETTFTPARPGVWDALPYSLAQWCQRPLKRTLKQQEPGKDRASLFAALLRGFRPAYSAQNGEWYGCRDIAPAPGSAGSWGRRRARAC